MKKIVRLTESDLTRIVKRVIQEEQKQINEGFNLKGILPTIAIVASLNLSSCKNKSDYEQKLPEIESLVKKQIEKGDKYFKSSSEQNDGHIDGIKFKKIVSIEGPIKKGKNSLKTYFIVVNVTEDVDGVLKNGYFIDIYEEDNNGKGKIVGNKINLYTMKDVSNQIESYKNYERWDIFNSYSEYMDELYRVDLSLLTMKNEYSGIYDELEISSDRYNQPSDYYKEIDDHIENLQDLKIDVKDDLKNNNVTQKEYDIIINGINEILPQLEEFKYSIK